MSNEQCIICSKHEDTTFEIYHSDNFVINHFVPRPGTDENYLGYNMIESRRHFKGFYEATEDEAKALGLAQRALSKAIKKALDCEHVYFFVLGDGVPHLHIHVIAKYPDAPREYWGLKVDEWPDAPRGGADEILKINEAVKSKLEKEL